MIKIISDLPNNVLGFESSGTVTGEDYETVLIPAVEEKLKAFPKVRLLYHLGSEFTGYDMEAMWDDAKIGFKHLKAWEKTKPANVEFARVPAIFRPDWEVQARVYYALNNMGKIDDMHGKIFTAIHKNKKRLDKKALIADFIEKNGVDRKKFLEEYDSFAVDGMVRKAKKKIKADY